MGSYDLELQKAIDKIKEKNYKLVMIQLPDGIKPEAKEIVDKIQGETDSKVIIWAGSCFGACDTPMGIEKLKVDLFLQWGHNFFNKIEGW